MYLYITTKLNEGYKVGITNDIEKRQQQYTTLIPNIKYYLYVQTSAAEEIEKSFKHKFVDYRIINKTSSKEMKSEVYQVKIKYLLMHFMNCIHMCKYSVILTDSEYPFTEGTYINNKINLYLSNYYLPFKNYNAKFIRFNAGMKIKVGEIEVGDAEFDKNNKIIKHGGKLTLYDFNLNEWKKIINLFFENVESGINQENFDKIIENLNFKKNTENVVGQYIMDYISPWEAALAIASRNWFHKLIEFKNLRNFNIDKLEDKGGWTTKRLRFFGQPYPLKTNRMELTILPNNDKLI